MRLVILSQYYPPETGAPQTRLSELATGLHARGWQVEVVTALPNYPHGRILQAYRNRWRLCETMGGIPVRRYWLYASNAPSALPRIVSMLSFSLSALCALPRLWRFRPNYLLVESPPLTLGFTGWLLCAFSKPRLVFNVSDLWPLTAKELGAVSDGRFYQILERLESFLYRRAFICTGQSEEIIRHIERSGGRRTHLFRNGVDLSRFPLEGDRKKPVRGKLRLVYTGLLGVAQGIVGICQNVDFENLGVEFHLYGAGAERVLLEDFLLKHPQTSIFYHGSVASDEIPDILSQYDAALISLVREIHGAVPSKMYEAMAAGLPIFFSGGGEGARIVETRRVGWVSPPGDYAHLSRNIALFVATDTESRAAVAQRSRWAAEQHFSRAIQIENLDELLRENL